MEAYVMEWIGLLARWLHFVVGIAWIGSSFYFVWLDNHLQPPASASDAEQGVGGELWSVHGGGFYHARKYAVAPGELPRTLHWFKWEAYSTWLSGMFLLALIYWYGADIYLVDPAVADLSPTVAAAIGAGFIAAGWLVYDLLCKSMLGRSEALFSLTLLGLVILLAWSLCQLFGGRGAYMHFGAVLGTIMVANVYFVIIPGQRRMVEATARGVAPDPQDGIRAKQRSVHNTYFTLPVLFVMISNHYAMTYGHAYNWAILAAVTLAGALIREYFVARHKGAASPLTLVAAAIVLLGVAVAIAPARDTAAVAPVSLSAVGEIMAERCVSCHSQSPTHPAFPSAPAGVKLDSAAQIEAEAQRIHQQTVVTRAMPIGNLTGITDEERQLIDRWYRSLGGQQ
jgi:uncharacterized membrane protein